LKLQSGIVSRLESVEESSNVSLNTEGETWYELPGCHHIRSENADTRNRCYVEWVRQSLRNIMVKRSFDSLSDSLL
jgi:hypothetical protein